jgi:hypothetical protein
MKEIPGIRSKIRFCCKFFERIMLRQDIWGLIEGKGKVVEFERDMIE